MKSPSTLTPIMVDRVYQEYSFIVDSFFVHVGAIIDQTERSVIWVTNKEQGGGWTGKIS